MVSDMAACAAFIRDRLAGWEREAHSHWTMDTEKLAQVAAMRAILLDYRNVEGTLSALEESDDPARFEWAEQERTLDRTLRHLAAIWSSHPEYNPAWAPDA